jgi:phosphatidylserine/phosphatidylglycerophosphate/cardiolipin synthase-like enzyme
VTVARWFLTASERGNPDTRLDDRHDGTAWSTGNTVRPLVHGATYFRELLHRIRALDEGDLLLFTDWRGDPDELLDGPGTAISDVLCDAARRGVLVRGLVWRSHLDRFSFSEQQNRHLGEDIEAAGGRCLRDMRVSPGGSHHQKLVVLRSAGDPGRDVAFAGGIDLCHSRNDDETHAGDPKPQPMAAVYGDRPPWHDVQLAIAGPAVGDIEASFRERWDDPSALTRNPVDRVIDLLRREDDGHPPIPRQLPDPAPQGSCAAQVLRTYPARSPGYPFATDGERSVARAYLKATSQARTLIYIEDQYLWNGEIVRCLADALERSRELQVVAVIPRYPDQDGRFSLPPNLVGRQQALRVLYAAGGDRVGIYSPENHAGTPVYVHAKVGIVDDVWASVGSDNLNRRSWTHDSELSCAVLDEERDEREPRVVDAFGDGARRFARDLRLQLAREHLDRDDDDGLIDPAQMAHEFRRSAEALERWHRDGRHGPRPAGRLRPYRMEPLRRHTLAWATPLYRVIYDPDGRPLRMKLRRRF